MGLVHILYQVTKCETSNMKEKQNDSSWSSGGVQKSDSSAKNSCDSPTDIDALTESADKISDLCSTEESVSRSSPLADASGTSGSTCINSHDPVDEGRDDGSAASSSGSPWYQLRKDATAYVSQTLQRGRRNLWQLTTSRATVMLSSAAICASSIHQFLKIYEDLSVFILAGEAFCGVEAVEFRQKLKIACETYTSSFHRQNICVSWLHNF